MVEWTSLLKLFHQQSFAMILQENQQKTIYQCECVVHHIVLFKSVQCVHQTVPDTNLSLFVVCLLIRYC